MDKKVEFKVTAKVADTYDFLLMHVYGSVRGWVGVFISILAFILLIKEGNTNDSFRTLLLVLIAALFTIIQPIQLFFKAAQQVKLNPNATKPLYYVLDQEGIHVKQDEEEMTLPWENVIRVKKSFRSIIVYSSKIHAFIIPKAEVGDLYHEIAEIIYEYAPKGTCKKKL